MIARDLERLPIDAKIRTTTRVKKPPSRRNRSYFGPEKMRAAFLAGQGRNAGEIAAELGGTTAKRVYDMLNSCGIKLARPFGRPKTVQIHCTNTDLARLEAEAAAREVDPGDLALHMLRVLLAEPVLMKNFLDEVDP